MKMNGLFNSLRRKPVDLPGDDNKASTKNEQKKPTEDAFAAGKKEPSKSEMTESRYQKTTVDPVLSLMNNALYDINNLTLADIKTLNNLKLEDFSNHPKLEYAIIALKAHCDNTYIKTDNKLPYHKEANGANNILAILKLTQDVRDNQEITSDWETVFLSLTVEDVTKNQNLKEALIALQTEYNQATRASAKIIRKLSELLPESNTTI